MNPDSFTPMLPLNPPADAAVPVPDRPTTFIVRVFDPTDYAMLAPGGDAFGIIPDLANKRQNKVTWFGEIFQGLGIPYHVLDTCSGWRITWSS